MRVGWGVIRLGDHIQGTCVCVKGGWGAGYVNIQIKIGIMQSNECW